MDPNDVNSEFIGIIEESLADVKEAAGTSAISIELLRSISKMNELSTYLSRYAFGHTVMPDNQKPLDPEIFDWLSEINTVIDIIVKSLLNCDCADCTCSCDELEDENELCESCTRYENCECEVDFTCETCLEYDRNHGTD